MGSRQRIKFRKQQPKKPATDKPVDEIVRELLICAKCGREVDSKDRRLLTVHHKDGNRLNNPPDGSNWENLCIYCHEDEHSRGLLGDYLRGKGGRDI